MNPDACAHDLDDWPLVCQLLPPGWQEQALLLGALRRARGFPDAAVLLRTLLVHLAGGCSLKETVTSAQQAGWCDVSAVALFQRLRAAEQWLRWMANELWQRHPTPSLPHGCRARAIDATSVSRPGSRGTDWRVHFSVNLVDLQCDFIEVTDVHGGETFQRIPAAAGDLLLGDRCYGTPPGIAHVVGAGAHVLVRVNHKSLPLWDIEGEPFRLVAELRATRVGQVREWPTVVRHGGRDYPGRLVAVKRDRWSARLERRALRKRASRKQKKLSRTARFLAGYFFVWTDVSTAMLDATAVLAWYRCRWQIELYFKRMKSILGLGDLPKRREDSSRAWLHGKLLVALLLERLLDHVEHFSPWGYELAAAAQSLA
jgi:Transposase DDE domain